MIKFTNKVDTRITIHFSVAGNVKEYDIVGAICSTVAAIMPDYNIIALQNNKRLGQLKLNLYEHKAEKTNKVMTVGVLYLETNLDAVDNAILVSTIEMVNKVHLHDAKFRYKQHEATKENNISEILKRSKELYSIFAGPQKEDVRRDIKSMVLENIGPGVIKTFKGYNLGPSFFKETEVLVVEGRNDVLNLMKANYNNVISVGGFNFDEKELCNLLKDKVVTVFMDADSGGHQNLLKISNVVDIKYIVSIPENKKVEELSTKEILDAINNKKLFVKDTYVNQ